ncbi:MAG TPA: TRAP transporter small permease [Firmicutes bacterium]|nr:TRAP transporter small permease [Bacillota bacterium]
MTQRREDKLFRTLYNIAGIMMMVMVGVIFLQVVARYVLHNSLSWSEEVGRYLFVWITFIGAALAVRKHAHVALDSFLRICPPKIQKIMFIIGHLAMLCLAFTMVYAGILMLDLGKKQVSAALQIPMIYVYIIIPVAGALMAFYLVLDFLRYFGPKGGDTQ